MDNDLRDNYVYSDDEIDDKNHDKLIENVLKLNKVQQLKKPSRSEPTLQISEFNLVKSITGKKGSVKIDNLTKILKNRKHAKIANKVEKTNKKSGTLPKPLEKPQAERIKRSVAYEKTKLELDRWEPIVTSNRVSQLSFPLEQPQKLEEKLKSFTDWRVKSKLQKELEALQPVEEYHIGENKEKYKLTMKELIEKRKEAAKFRAHQSYKEAKARRQNKIKSKKYHRIQRKEKIKQQLKEFEALQKTNPEEALKKLDEIEKIRAEERFSLRHRSTGKWAKSKQIRAKYDKESRQALSQQLATSRDLTQKIQNNSSDEDDNIELPSVHAKDKNNPWVNGTGNEPTLEEFIGSYKKFWNEKNKEKENSDKTKNNNEVPQIIQIKETVDNNEELNGNLASVELEETITDKGKAKKKSEKRANKKKLLVKEGTVPAANASTDDWSVDVIDDIFDKLENNLKRKVKKKERNLKHKLKQDDKPSAVNVKDTNNYKADLSLPLNKPMRPQVDDELINASEEEKELDNHLKSLKDVIQNKSKEVKNDIDPDKFIKVKATDLNTAIPDLLTTEDDEGVQQRQIISEAFEDDDIIQDFNKEKVNEINKDIPKDIDLTLPGWGEWGGTNIKITKRKKRRFIIKAPKKMPRKDDNKGSLIINEQASKKLKDHMVSEVPFPFKSVKDFEASIRAPIGNTFVSQTAFKKLTKPSLLTKMGTVIDPMDKSVLLKKSVS